MLHKLIPKHTLPLEHSATIVQFVIVVLPPEIIFIPTVPYPSNSPGNIPPLILQHLIITLKQNFDDLL